MNKSIVCENLEKFYGSNGKKVCVLKGLNLSIDRGDFVSVAGPSGAGKSTLLHILGAIDRPTGGRVYLDGIDINRMNDKRLAELRNTRVGLVFQFYHLLPEFSVLENVLLPSMIAGANSVETRRKAEGLLERVELGKCADKYCFELSGGEMQRVAICRALINDPDIILADEPTGNLDSAAACRVLEILRELNEKENRTLVIATHDEVLAGNAKRLVAIRDGKLE